MKLKSIFIQETVPLYSSKLMAAHLAKNKKIKKIKFQRHQVNGIVHSLSSQKYRKHDVLLFETNVTIENNIKAKK